MFIITEYMIGMIRLIRKCMVWYRGWSSSRHWQRSDWFLEATCSKAM